ncbi:MAG: hydrogenase [Candidatus Omnitrophica bacterium]|nr:hydrogenase [Candidatus Omnitrophota bacterium]
MLESFQWPWHVPFGEFALKLDSLSLIFLTAVTILVLCAGVYAVGYMRQYRTTKSMGLHIFFYFLLSTALVLIVLANNVILFLGAWEMMSISTYFLIVFNDEKSSVRRAGFLYLIMSHCGTFLLILMFFLMAHNAGSMNFEIISHSSFPVAFAGSILLLAIIGFGIKAGFVPVHIWLPHAHPAAPTHISAILSGVAIKMGIYGICRVLWIIGVLPDWCGYLILIIGVVCGLMGVLYALGQHELKKLLAYHSIENIGIISLGLGVGLLGQSHHMPFLSVLGFGGALLHVLNHAIFKGLLFMGAGCVIQRTHTSDMDLMGGLARTMPLVSILFLVGALAICGLPLFNGFISEFIIYFGLFQGLFHLPLQGAFTCAVGIISLALMGALALACFTKVYGTVFLGEPRHLQEPPSTGKISLLMIIPMLVLGGLCLWIGLFPQIMANAAFQGGAYLSHTDLASLPMGTIFYPLSLVISGVFLFFALVLALVGIRRKLLQGHAQPVRETWGCGFFQMTPKIQYTSSSFALLIVDFVKGILFFRREGGDVKGKFPAKTSMSSSVHDASEEFLFKPLFARLTSFSKKLDMNRIRYTQIYLMYIFLYLIFLLVWKLK